MLEQDQKNKESAAKMEKYRKEHGISYTFIGNATEYSHSHVRQALLNKVALTENLRKKINKLWQTDF